MKKKTTKILILQTIFLFSLFSVIYPIENCVASENIIYVDDSGGMNYTSIQPAIDAASPGDSIYVYSGTYNENLYIDKSINIIGIYTTSRPVIIGQDPVKSTIEIMTDSVSVSGFKIRNYISDTYNGISCGKTQFLNQNVNYNTIEDCEITDSKYGILIKGSNNVVNTCVIHDNSENGLTIVSGEYNTINQNTLDNNLRGIYLQQSSNNNQIYDNTISENSIYGINIVQSFNNNIYHNHFIGNSQNARDICENDWDNGYPSGGNYWDDYNNYDSNEDGIGDSPYDIDGGENQDLYPLGEFLNPNPEAYIDSIEPNPATLGQSVSFNGHGQDDGTILQWEWKSNKDGDLSSSEDFSYSSLSEGTHTISFRVKDDDDVWSEYVQETLVINPIEVPDDPEDPDDPKDPENPENPSDNIEPIAYIDSITPNPSEYMKPVIFTGHGMDEDGSIVEWRWESSKDGVIGDTESFNISDLSLGKHTIYFKVRDNASKWSKQVTESLTVSLDPLNKPPIALANGPFSGDIGVEIAFDGSESYDEDGEIVGYLWDFGDGTTGSEHSILHTYSSYGNYSITLTVSDDDGEDAVYETIAIICESSGQNSDSSDESGFSLSIPFPLIIIAEAAFVIIGISMFLLWFKRK